MNRPGPKRKPRPAWTWDERRKRPVSLRRWNGIKKALWNLGSAPYFVWPHHCLYCHHSWAGPRALPTSTCPRCLKDHWWHAPSVESRPGLLYNILRCPVCRSSIGDKSFLEWLRLIAAYYGVD